MPISCYYTQFWFLLFSETPFTGFITKKKMVFILTNGIMIQKCNLQKNG